MAKINNKAQVLMWLNTEKGGAWIADFKVLSQVQNGLGGYDPIVEVGETTAWKNASAAKRWVKAMVQKHTPRKSIKLEPTINVIEGKETITAYRGEISYKK